MIPEKLLLKSHKATPSVTEASVMGQKQLSVKTDKLASSEDEIL
jgi:hypothetical protein